MNGKTIWAPWRIDYILADKTRGCFLCDAFARADDPASLVLIRTDRIAVVMNRYPYTGGHLMVCPLRHVSELSDLDAGEQAELAAWTSHCVEILRETMRPDGFNIGINLGEAAGAGLRDHVHQHVVPRWVGDTNFVTVLGDIRVIPEALEAIAGRLRPRFAARA